MAIPEKMQEPKIVIQEKMQLMSEISKTQTTDQLTQDIAKLKES